MANRRSLFVLCLICVTANAPVWGEDIYVAPNGSDHFIGTKARPLETLDAARKKARQYAGVAPVTVHIADGI